MAKPIYDPTTHQFLEPTAENKALVLRNMEARYKAQFEAERDAVLGVPGLRPELQQAAENKRQRQSAAENFMSGLGGELGAIVEGAKGWAGQGDPNAQMQVALNQALPGVPAAAGRMVGAMAPLMAGGLVGRTVAGALAARVPAAALGASSRLAPIAGEAALGAGYEALKAPDNPLPAAALGAAGGALFPALGAGYKTAFEAKGTTPYARELLDAGVPLTPGQASGSRWRQNLEQRMEAMPITGQVLLNQQDKALQGWDRYMLKKVAPEPDNVTSFGSEGVHQVAEQFRRKFDEIDSHLPERVNIDSTLDRMQTAAADRKRTLSPDASATLDATLADLERYRGQGVPREHIRQLRQDIEAASDAQYGHDNQLFYHYGDMAKAIKNSINEALPPGMADANRELSRQYSLFMPVRLAHTYKGARRGGESVMTPSHLDDAIWANAGRSGKTLGSEKRLPLQADANQAYDIFARTLPKMGPGTAEKLSWLAGGALGMTNPKMAAALVGMDAALALGTAKLRKKMTGQEGAGVLGTPGLLTAPGIDLAEWATGGGF